MAQKITDEIIEDVARGIVERRREKKRKREAELAELARRKVLVPIFKKR